MKQFIESDKCYSENKLRRVIGTYPVAEEMRKVFCQLKKEKKKCLEKVFPIK